MIEVKLSGGLGNQLFQYAYAKKLQKYVSAEGNLEPIILNGTMLRLRDPLRNPELQHFTLNPTARAISSVVGLGGLRCVRYLLRYGRVFWRPFLVKKFKGRTPTPTEEDFERASEKGIIWVHNPYSFRLPKCSLPTLKYCLGYFQSYSTVKDMEKELRGDLTIKENVLLSQDNARLLEEISKTQSVCVHIRRGDYLNPENHMYNVCTEEYYRRAVQAAEKELSAIASPVFYVFSGSKKDIEYIRNHYDLGQNVRYVDLDNGTVEDFRLMKACKHFIISNSTYSWWAAVLGAFEAKKVWAPESWRKDQPQAADELYAPTWVRIKV